MPPISDCKERQKKKKNCVGYLMHHIVCRAWNLSARDISELMIDSCEYLAIQRDTSRIDFSTSLLCRMHNHIPHT